MLPGGASGVLHREQPAPRLPEQDEVAAVQAAAPARTCSTSSTKRASSHSDGSSGWSLRKRAELVVVVVLDAGPRGTRCRSTRRTRRSRPGPPCSSSTLRSGLVPTRLVHTRKSPPGVLDRDHPRATREHVARVPGRGVEVGRDGCHRPTLARTRGASSGGHEDRPNPPPHLSSGRSSRRRRGTRCPCRRDRSSRSGPCAGTAGGSPRRSRTGRRRSRGGRRS